jgi:hypothetical protein
MDLSSAIADVWHNLASGGAGLWLLVGGAAIALASVLAYPFLRRAAWVPLLATSISVLGGVLLVERGRGWMIDAAVHHAGDVEARANALANGVTLQMNGLAAIGVVVGWLVLLAMPVMGIPWALRLRRAKRPLLAPLLTAYALAGLAMVAVRGMLLWALGAIHVFTGVAGVDPSIKTILVRQGFVEAGAHIVQGRAVILYAGAVAAAAMAVRAVRAARRGEHVGNPLLVASLLLFVLGGAAFATTRTRAADAEEPLSVEGTEGFVAENVHAPSVERCGPAAAPLELGPIVMVGDTLKLNGRPIAGFDQLNDDLVTIWNNFRLLHPNDFKSVPVLLVAAEAAQPVAPFLEKWRSLKSNYSLQMVAYLWRPVDTRTVGRIERFQVCAYRISLGRGRKPPATFGELAAAFSTSDQPFSVELP